MMLRQLFLSVALLGVSLASSIAVYNAAPAVAEEVVQTAQAMDTSEADVADRINIEVPIEIETGSIAREFTFRGEAGETVMVHLEAEEDGGLVYPPRAWELYDAKGELVPPDYNGFYPSFGRFEVVPGMYRTFVLPAVGEYRFVLEDGIMSFAGVEPRRLSYLLRVSIAENYERLILTAEDHSIVDEYDEALELLALAVEDSPERPEARISRIFVYSELLFSTPDFDARLDELGLRENDNMYREADKMSALIYETFNTLEPEKQMLVASDLRQIAQAYSAATADGKLKLVDGVEPAFFTEAAEFLETGTFPNSLRQLFFVEPELVEENDI